MGLQAGKPSQYVTATRVDSTFYPPCDGKISINFRLSNNKKWRWWKWFTGCLYRRACGSSRLAWSKGRQPPDTMLYSSRESSELSQWLYHDDSTINIVVVMISIIILQAFYQWSGSQEVNRWKCMTKWQQQPDYDGCVYRHQTAAENEAAVGQMHGKGGLVV